jgi:tRNA dimethylallyltransferase
VSAPDIIVVGGQTASGKSALAMQLARDHGGEIVGADSRQLYRGLPVASAGPNDHERAEVPHHLYETVDPANSTLTAGAFLDAADAAVDDIRRRGKCAIIVGGTGLYLRAWRLGLADGPPSNPAMRAALQRDLQEQGLAALVARLRLHLADVDDRVDIHNPVRVLRALEMVDAGVDLTSQDIGRLLARPPRSPATTASWLLVEPEPAVVEGAIVARTRRMFDHGIVEEALALRAALPPDHPLLETMGVKEALDVADTRCGVDDAVAAVIARTRQYARRQRTWFRKEPWWTRTAA